MLIRNRRLSAKSVLLLLYSNSWLLRLTLQYAMAHSNRYIAELIRVFSLNMRGRLSKALLIAAAPTLTFDNIARLVHNMLARGSSAVKIFSIFKYLFVVFCGPCLEQMRVE